MAFLSTNRYRDSWAYRSQNGGFSKRPGGEDNEQSASLGKSATTDNVAALNKSLSQMQFNSRPNTPTNNRAVRPSSAGATGSRGVRLNTDLGANRRTKLPPGQSNPNDVKFINGQGNTNNRENFASASNTQTLKVDPSTVTLNPNSSSQIPSSKVPRYVETDKQVMRFYCHFFDKETQITHHPDLLKVKHPSTARLFTLLVYLSDFTLEIAEDKQVNSGHRGGQFFKRGYLKKDDHTDITIKDFSIGGTLSVLGHDFFITDCDAFTRGYFR